MCPDPALCGYFEKAVAAYPKNPKAIANMLVNDLLRELSASEESAKQTDEFGEPEAAVVHVSTAEKLAKCKLSPENLASLVKIVDSGVISKQMAKEVFVEMCASGESADAIVEKRGLKQNSNSDELEKFCLDAMAGNQKAIDQFKAGNEKAINALVGPVMKASKGKANPAMVLEILKKLIK